MKKIILLILCLVLCGCSKVNVDNLYDDLDTLLNNLDFTYDNRINNASTYFGYYMPSDMQDFEGNENSSIIVFENSKTIMNLNISSIIDSTYYNSSLKDDGFFKESLLTYEKSGEFIKNDGEQANYRIKIYKDGSAYLVHLMTNELNFYTSCKDYNLVDVTKRLFIIAKSVEVEKDKLLANYSRKDIIEYERKQIDLFEYDIPTSGFLSDLVNQSGGTVVEETPEIIEENVNEEIVEDEE